MKRTGHEIQPDVPLPIRHRTVPVRSAIIPLRLLRPFLLTFDVPTQDRDLSCPGLVVRLFHLVCHSLQSLSRFGTRSQRVGFRHFSFFGSGWCGRRWRGELGDSRVGFGVFGPIRHAWSGGAEDAKGRIGLPMVGIILIAGTRVEE